MLYRYNGGVSGDGGSVWRGAVDEAGSIIGGFVGKGDGGIAGRADGVRYESVCPENTVWRLFL